MVQREAFTHIRPDPLRTEIIYPREELVIGSYLECQALLEMLIAGSSVSGGNDAVLRDRTWPILRESVIDPPVWESSDGPFIHWDGMKIVHRPDVSLGRVNQSHIGAFVSPSIGYRGSLEDRFFQRDHSGDVVFACTAGPLDIILDFDCVTDKHHPDIQFAEIIRKEMHTVKSESGSDPQSPFQDLANSTSEQAAVRFIVDHLNPRFFDAAEKAGIVGKATVAMGILDHRTNRAIGAVSGDTEFSCITPSVRGSRRRRRIESTKAQILQHPDTALIDGITVGARHAGEPEEAEAFAYSAYRDKFNRKKSDPAVGVVGLGDPTFAHHHLATATFDASDPNTRILVYSDGMSALASHAGIRQPWLLADVIAQTDIRKMINLITIVETQTISEGMQNSLLMIFLFIQMQHMRKKIIAPIGSPISDMNGIWDPEKEPRGKIDDLSIAGIYRSMPRYRFGVVDISHLHSLGSVQEEFGRRMKFLMDNLAIR